jgi:hypothetical protein
MDVQTEPNEQQLGPGHGPATNEGSRDKAAQACQREPAATAGCRTDRATAAGGGASKSAMHQREQQVNKPDQEDPGQDNSDGLSNPKRQAQLRQDKEKNSKQHTEYDDADEELQ